MATLQNFGVPNGAGKGPMLAPKLKFKFRVRLIGFGPIATPLDLSAQVESVTKPTSNWAEVEVHSYNSVAYMAGKHNFNTIDLVIRDDVTNAVQRIVGHQVQKQMNFFQQTTPLAGSNYKFDMKVEAMSGGNDEVLETWDLEGCWVTTFNYGDNDYKDTSGYSTVTMTIRFDNATLNGGLWPLVPELKPGILV